MYFNSDLPTENVQSASHAMPIARAPDDELYRATWDNSPLPASRHQSFDSPGRPVAQKIYQQILDLQVGRWPDEDRRWRVLRDYYFNAIRDCDRKVELLLDALRNNGMDKNTIVIFSADHGELGGNHQMRGKGTNAYWQQNHLPLMIHHPAFQGGRRVRGHHLAARSHADHHRLDREGRGGTGPGFGRAEGQGFLVMAAQPGPGRGAVDQARCPVQLRHVVLPGPEMGRADRRYPGVSHEDAAGAAGRAGRASAGLPNRVAIRSIWDGRYRFSRYFSPVRFNTPGSLEELFEKNDVEVYDRRNDPEEMNNLATRPETKRRSHPGVEPGGQPAHRGGGRGGQWPLPADPRRQMEFSACQRKIGDERRPSSIGAASMRRHGAAVVAQSRSARCAGGRWSPRR